MEISFTLDVEDHRASAHEPPRHLGMIREILSFLAERGMRGTFFVIGEVAEQDAGLVREIAAGGHEVAVHGRRHVPLNELGPERFRVEAESTKARLSDLAQQPVVGFRAPMFSLVPETHWAVEILNDLGFSYSSSVMPIRHPLFGDSGYPVRPFGWPGGLVELPCPVVRCGPFGLPWLGAVWLRNLPWPLVHLGLVATGTRRFLWTYGHPYDFDTEEPFRVLPEAGRIGSRLIWHNRHRMFDKLDRLLRFRVGPPLVERLATLPDPLPTVPAAALA
jgi:peptidoglycan-N-acetylglucosamine deacetylase